MKEKETILVRLSNLLLERKDDTGDNSYTAQLYKAGSVKILEKIKEEADELIEAGSADTIKNQEIIHEAADLWFHTMVLLAFNEINPLEILKELERREVVSGIEEKSRRS
jgi:phosphoribosyl-ATP pyrophosphohydrolase